MPYTINPRLPKLRAKAVNLVRQGKSIREVARYFSFSPSTVSRWNKKVPVGGAYEIPTKSSRPKNHPKQLERKIVERIIELRKITRGRCSEVIHQHLANEGVKVSLSSVKRTLERNYLIRKRSPWKRYHPYKERPKAANPGDLVEVDTIHLMKNTTERIYIYTLIDIYSRWAYARASNRANARKSIEFIGFAKRKFPFTFNCLQSDHGSEFSQHFSERVKITHRHCRVRKPNDNAHLERFNRTLQTEFLNRLPKEVETINKYLPKYLEYYNEKRLHMGINLKTPKQYLAKCCEGID